MYACLQACVYVYMHVYLHVCVYACVYACLYVYMGVGGYAGLVFCQLTQIWTYLGGRSIN